MAQGKITQIIGAVIDVEFPRESIPNIYEALSEQLGQKLEATRAPATIMVIETVEKPSEN